ncbi:hypothetical protein [Streptomyces orinoci]|uniref:Uncharacterized protein n=1 Tax=Streptomyces orinoci TaxID=67339 RepID=A0ABV3K6Q1_STRON|nr:hypothetical protein [Streptomyces orinoci]
MSLSRILLPSGRSIELTEVRMASTYGGMLEGYPCQPVNEIKLRGLLRTAEGAFPGTPVHLVSPSREYPDESAGAFGPVEVLPPVACVGKFRSAAVSCEHDPVRYRSVLTVAWFQHGLEVPSGDGLGLRDVPWEDLAQDYEL